MITIAVDAMGGDYAPDAVIDGVGRALDATPDTYRFLLVGLEEKLQNSLKRIGKRGDSRIELVHAEEVVHMDDAPAAAMRSKRKSSINVAVELVKEGKAAAVISAGNTGAAVASTVVKLRTLQGIERPGIAPAFPSPSGHFVLLDAGATVDCKPIHLVHYAVMGDVYAQHILGYEKPRIGLLNVGGEQLKGNELTKETYKLLKELPRINFVGNVEGHDLFCDNVDVVVCDGFVGNVVLKCCENLASTLGSMMRQFMKKSIWRKSGYMLARNAFRELKGMSDYAEYGGAPLLGVDGVCIIGHGSSCPRAIQNAIRVAGEFVEHQVNRHIIERIANLGLHESDNDGEPAESATASG
mgnify:CR=1 FL=1